MPYRLVRAAIINEGNVPVADPIRGLKTSTGGSQQANSFKCRKLQIDDNLDLCVLTNAFVVCPQSVGFNGEHDIGLDRTSVRREASREKPIHDHAGNVLPFSSVVGDLWEVREGSREVAIKTYRRSCHGRWIPVG